MGKVERMKKVIYILLAAVFCAGCSRHHTSERQQAPLQVKGMVVTPQSETGSSRYVGVIEPVRSTPLSMQSTGRVVTIGVKNGQRVHAGQVILEIDNTQAMNALRTAEASFKHAQDGYDRVKGVHAKGVVSDQKMVEIESQLAQARSLYEAAKQQVSECQLKAPCEGVLDGLNAEKGQTILPGTRVCSILDVSAFAVRFSVPEAEVKHLGKAGEVECAAAKAVLPIVISEKGISANTLTHTYEVTARIQGGADVLMNGMVAVVRMPNGAASRDELVVPAHCGLLKPEGPTVGSVEQGKAVRRQIKTAGYHAEGVLVSEGLHSGDTVIVEGYQKLYNGCKVNCEL